MGNITTVGDKEHMVDRRHIYNKYYGEEHIPFSEEFFHNSDSKLPVARAIDLDKRRKLFDRKTDSSSTDIVINMLFGD